MMKNFRIGFYRVRMTDEMAARWNAGESTCEDFDLIMVCVPLRDRGLPYHREVPLSEFVDRNQDIADSGFEAVQD